MSRTMRFLVLGFASLFAHAACAADDADVRARIEAVNAAFSKGVEARSAASMAAGYEENARLLPPNEAEVLGKAAIELYWQGMLDHGVSGAKLVVDEVHSDGAIAVERGHADIAFKDPQTAPATVRYIVVWSRQADGAWKIRYDIWNDPPKPAPVAEPEVAAPAPAG